MDNQEDKTPLTSDELITYSKSKSSTLIVIDFKATWCGPCKAIKPFITYLHENYPNVEFLEIDIEDDTRNTIVSTFKIKKVPTFVFYKDGELCNSLIGTDKAKLEEFVNEYL
jgi:thioredoxin 1